MKPDAFSTREDSARKGGDAAKTRMVRGSHTQQLSSAGLESHRQEARTVPGHAVLSLVVLALSASNLAGCQTPTQLLVEVRAVGSIAERTSQMQARINDVMIDAFDGQTLESFPVSFGVEPSDGDLSRAVRIEVTLLNPDGATVATGSAVEMFVDGEKVTVVIEVTRPFADGGIPDSGLPDGGISDGGLPDDGAPDDGTPDAGTPDTGTPDVGVDARTDAVAMDSGRDAPSTCPGVFVYCARLGECVDPRRPESCGLGCDLCDSLRPVCGPNSSGVLVCQGGCMFTSECITAGTGCCCSGDLSYSGAVCRPRLDCEESFACRESG